MVGKTYKGWCLIKSKMKKKYKEFSKKFEELCEEYAADDFDCVEVKQVCDEIIDNYGD